MLTNWNWYETIPPQRNDINNNDDDYDGTNMDVDWIEDNDGDAFKYKFWIVLPNESDREKQDKEDKVVDNHYIQVQQLIKINIFSNLQDYEAIIAVIVNLPMPSDLNYINFNQQITIDPVNI